MDAPCRELFNNLLHIPQIQKFAGIQKRWQPIQLVSALTSLALKEVIKCIHANNMTFAALSLCLLAEGAVVNFSGWGCLLFASCCHCHWCTRPGKDHALGINGIHAKGMKFLLLSWMLTLLCACKVAVLNFSCWAWLSFVWCCCCHCNCYHWNKSDHALLIAVVPNDCYFSPNSVHTRYTP